MIVREVLDTASMASIVSERSLKSLPCSRSPKCTPVSGFIMMPFITHQSPLRQIPEEIRNLVTNIVLAEPTFDQSLPIDCILGADLAAAVISGAPWSLGPGLPCILPNKLEHVILGTAPDKGLQASSDVRKSHSTSRSRARAHSTDSSAFSLSHVTSTPDTHELL